MTPTPSDRPGLFVVSLDFELHWGIRDHSSVGSARDRLIGARTAVPVLLDLFARRRVRATWATVGMLMAHDRAELESMIPAVLPRYDDARLSPYPAMREVGNGEADDPFHYAPSLVEQIIRTPGQEVGTHTFSHYYCLEPGQDAAAFAADLDAARRVAAGYGVEPRSIVFPRNQFNPHYLGVLARAGVRAYRTNPPTWFYAPQRVRDDRLPARATRLLDAYAPVASVIGSRAALATPGSKTGDGDRPRAVQASVFLRPYSSRLRALDSLRVRRIRSAMDVAAREGGVFHLWWHPHNFGRQLRENLRVLEAVLDHFEMLRRSQRMESATMLEAAWGPS